MLFYIKLYYSEENCVPVNIIFKRQDYSTALYSSESTTSFYTKKKRIFSLKKYSLSLFFRLYRLAIKFDNNYQDMSINRAPSLSTTLWHKSSAWPLQKLQPFQQPLPYFTFYITNKRIKETNR